MGTGVVLTAEWRTYAGMVCPKGDHSTPTQHQLDLSLTLQRRDTAEAMKCAHMQLHSTLQLAVAFTVSCSLTMSVYIRASMLGGTK